MLIIYEHNLDVNANIFGTGKVSGDLLDVCVNLKYTLKNSKTSYKSLASQFIGSELVKDIIQAFENAVEDF